jgi:tetratricopeptide (TPR) repeat protein
MVDAIAGEAGTTLLARGLELHQAGRTAEAEAVYRRVLEADPRNADAWHLFGVLAHQTGHHDVALSLLRQAIGLGSEVAERHFTLGNVFSGLGRNDEAASAFRAALERDQRHVGAWNTLAHVLRLLGQSGPSVDAAARAAALAPDLAALRVNAAIAAVHAGDHDAAIGQARAAVALAPEELDAYTYLGDSTVQLGRFDQARRMFERSHRLAPDRAEPINNLGHTLRELGDLAGAEACFERALRLKPDYPDAFNNRNALRVNETFSAERTRWRAAHPSPRVTRDLGGSQPLPPLVIDGVLTPEECRTIVGLEPELPEFKGLVGQTKGIDAKTVRRSNIRWIVCDARTRFIYEKVLAAMFEAADERFGCPLVGIEPMQLANYDETMKGFYDWHFDTIYFPRPDKPVRRLSISMQLTPETDYDGGSLQMRTPDGVISASRRQGAAIVFPSNTVHRVEPVRRGRRHSLVMWAHGPFVPGC